MAKSFTIFCTYNNNGTCNHAEQPHGPRPSPGVCAKACKHYTGDPAIEVNRPVAVTFSQGEKLKRAESGCGPCGSAAKSRVTKPKHDPAEAARILDEAMKTDWTEDGNKVD